MTDLERLIERQKAREVAKATPHHLRPRPDYDAIAEALKAEIAAQDARICARDGITLQQLKARRAEQAERDLRRSGRNSIGM
jgi:hypothetical protein